MSRGIEHVDQMDNSWIGGAHRHEGDFVKNFSCAVLAVADFCGIFGGVLHPVDPMTTLAHCSEHTTAKFQ